MASSKKIGVLLMNLGTPEAPTPEAVRKYLKEFLSDRRVVDLSPILWKPILNGIILNLRPRKVAKVYQQVWMDEGSPLLVLGNRLRDGVQNALDQLEDQYVVASAMTYGTPNVESAANQFRREGVSHIFVLPMYPQFSGTTTAAAYDRLMNSLAKCPDWPTLNLYHDYADHPLYIQALAKSVTRQWEAQGEKRHLVLSYHGIPKRYVTNGDPYARRCEKTSALLATQLGLNEDEWTHVYQSRFGREEWLQPYADKTLASMPASGLKRINVISPAFSIDCIETLEEVTLELGDEFKHNGGEVFDYIPALNDTSEHIALYKDIILENTVAWRDEP
ncbi:ferrochelatase [Marinomonas mediterranea]|uniref:Ferrochelatase n=1 Tax=Marinomonas mediterranea (strain ATCC 700492 / JCM 21426 / NBRC 103028 / MMB-1) TaxID=717774 RepID=F2K4K1_MARM1|nr:ferrochelatase [Marinomonas mediterranea]ADZ91394.1 Ferrochelatase [Marinomonas mediterranea MMB-1]WCN13443.1 ferrochelatase [Marinomonas mediterranea]WCN17509.1 ferrochelatase [Marinomonas mediterranea MMB-1]